MGYRQTQSARRTTLSPACGQCATPRGTSPETPSSPGANAGAFSSFYRSSPTNQSKICLAFFGVCHQIEQQCRWRQNHEPIAQSNLPGGLRPAGHYRSDSGHCAAIISANKRRPHSPRPSQRHNDVACRSATCGFVATYVGFSALKSWSEGQPASPSRGRSTKSVTVLFVRRNVVHLIERLAAEY